MGMPHRSRKRMIGLVPISLLLAGTLPAFPQDAVDYNAYYRFPLSLGVEYQSLSPFSSYGGQSNLFELSAGARLPLQTLPVLQPALRLGMLRFDSQDPDAPAALIRAVRFETPAVPPLFAAMQSWYARHPAGTVTITNTEKTPLAELKVSFFQAGYMDSPTPCPTSAELAPGESREVPLLASFNQEVFRTKGVTPLAGEIAVAYKLRGRAVEQKQAVSYDLQDKSAIAWDAARKDGREEDWNRLGIAYGWNARYPQAERAFREALRLDPAYLSAKINLGNLQLLKGEYAGALESMAAACKQLERTADAPAETVVNVLLNLSRTCYKLERFDEAKQHFASAQAVDPQRTAPYAWLAERGGDGNRERAAAQPDLAVQVLFVGEEE
jgi:tetratricopeptide (TPR) repeat protein